MGRPSTKLRCLDGTQKTWGDISCDHVRMREIKRRVAASKAAFIEPCLPTLAEKPPSGPRWLHEIKHDGYRLQARRDAEGAYLITRNGFDWTGAIPRSRPPCRRWRANPAS